MRDLSLQVYGLGAAHAESCGIILADTKFEFGELDDELLVIDEMLTPDSSRYWSAEDYRVGTSPPSFDKQYVRDHYLTTGWDQTAPAPRLPRAVIDGTRARYVRGLRAAHRARASTSGTDPTSESNATRRVSRP